jgi:type II secretory pathway pseudopilin PulG
MTAQRNRTAGFGLLETLMVMLLVGVILGIVARGYQTLSRLNLATYQMSQRMELSAFLQRLSYEVASAVSISTGSGTLSFDRVDPTLNLLHDQPAPARLPWPWPSNPTNAGLLNPLYLKSVSYTFDSANFKIERAAFGDTQVVAVNVGEFLVSLESGGRILDMSMRPKEMTSAVQARVFLPVVSP